MVRLIINQSFTGLGQLLYTIGENLDDISRYISIKVTVVRLFITRGLITALFMSYFERNDIVRLLDINPIMRL